MKFQGALIKEQGVTFAVVIVKKRIIDNRAEASKASKALAPAFPGVPVVLMAQDHQGLPTCYGRRDISRFMANVPLTAIPWREYTVQWG